MHWSPEMVSTITPGQFEFYRNELERNSEGSSEAAVSAPPPWRCTSDEEVEKQGRDITEAIERLSQQFPSRDTSSFDLFSEVLPEVERMKTDG